MHTFAHIEALRQQGFSFSQIGEQLGITKDAARGIFSRGLAGRQRARPDGSMDASVRGGVETADDPAGDGGSEPILRAVQPGRDRPGDLHRELAGAPACKLCAFLDGLDPVTRAEWEREIALPEIANAAIAAALRRRDFPIGESSVRRHRGSHVAV